LIPQYPHSSLIRMFEWIEIIVGQEPSLLVVIPRDISVAHEEDLPIGEQRDVGDEPVDVTCIDVHECSAGAASAFAASP
jgi:hypothetical protein